MQRFNISLLFPYLCSLWDKKVSMYLIYADLSNKRTVLNQTLAFFFFLSLPLIYSGRPIWQWHLLSPAPTSSNYSPRLPACCSYINTHPALFIMCLYHVPLAVETQKCMQDTENLLWPTLTLVIVPVTLICKHINLYITEHMIVCTTSWPWQWPSYLERNSNWLQPITEFSMHAKRSRVNYTQLPPGFMRFCGRSSSRLAASPSTWILETVGGHISMWFSAPYEEPFILFLLPLQKIHTFLQQSSPLQQVKHSIALLLLTLFSFVLMRVTAKNKSLHQFAKTVYDHISAHFW